MEICYFLLCSFVFTQRSCISWHFNMLIVSDLFIYDNSAHTLWEGFVWSTKCKWLRFKTWRRDMWTELEQAFTVYTANRNNQRWKGSADKLHSPRKGSFGQHSEEETTPPARYVWYTTSVTMQIEAICLYHTDWENKHTILEVWQPHARCHHGPKAR